MQAAAARAIWWHEDDDKTITALPASLFPNAKNASLSNNCEAVVHTEHPAKRKTISKAAHVRLCEYPRMQRHKCARYKYASIIVTGIAFVLLYHWSGCWLVGFAGHDIVANLVACSVQGESCRRDERRDGGGLVRVCRLPADVHGPPHGTVRVEHTRARGLRPLQYADLRGEYRVCSPMDAENQAISPRRQFAMSCGTYQPVYAYMCAPTSSFS